MGKPGMQLDWEGAVFQRSVACVCMHVCVMLENRRGKLSDKNHQCHHMCPKIPAASFPSHSEKRGQGVCMDNWDLSWAHVFFSVCDSVTASMGITWGCVLKCRLILSSALDSETPWDGSQGSACLTSLRRSREMSQQVRHK